jgi:hypothetical protein
VIPIDKLRALETLVTHDDCPDGLASALVLRDAAPSARVVFVQHGTVAYEALPAAPGMLFCDIAPPAKRADEFIAAGAVVLDHHRSAQSLIERFGALGVFADEEKSPGVSGASLAYREVWRPLCGDRDVAPERATAVRELAELAGIRDTWVRSSARWHEASVQAAALLFWPRERWLRATPAEWASLKEIGDVLVERQTAGARRLIGEALRFEAGGVRVAVFNAVWLTSEAAEELGDDADVVIGFQYRVDAGRAQVIFSLRSRGRFDVAAFAVANGGGGHTKAAGFSVPAPVDSGAGESPYALVRRLLTEYLGRSAAAQK